MNRHKPRLSWRFVGFVVVVLWASWMTYKYYSLSAPSSEPNAAAPSAHKVSKLTSPNSVPPEFIGGQLPFVGKIYSVPGGTLAFEADHTCEVVGVNASNGTWSEADHILTVTYKSPYGEVVISGPWRVMPTGILIVNDPKKGEITCIPIS